MKHVMSIKYFNFLVLFASMLLVFPIAALAYTEHPGGTINSDTWEQVNIMPKTSFNYL